MVMTSPRASRWQTLAAASSGFIFMLLPHAWALIDPVQDSDPVIVEVTIRGREFLPSTVVIPVNHAVLLSFANHDAELHAFAPSALLDDVPLHIDGNGAAQFGEHGLVRILIPSEGRAELRFTPQQAGLYDYRCDLPGHQMRAHIRVKE